MARSGDGVVIGHGEGADDRGPGLERTGGGDGRGGGRLDDLPTHPRPRPAPDPVGQLVPLGFGEEGGVDGGSAERRAHRMEDQPVQVGQHVAEPGSPAAPPGVGAAQLELLAQHSRGQLVEQPGQGHVLDHPGSERVHHRHPPPPGHLEQPGDPEQRVGPQLDRVAPLVVHPADDHVDRVEAHQRPQPHPVVVDHQVPALDQGVAEVGGQVGVLEVGLAQGAGGEDDHPGLVDAFGGGGGDPAADGAEEPGQPLDAGLAVQVGQHPGQDGPVDQRVPEPGRGLGPVARRPGTARHRPGPRRRR